MSSSTPKQKETDVNSSKSLKNKRMSKRSSKAEIKAVQKDERLSLNSNSDIASESADEV